jgi:cytochrome c peroxidase
MPLRTFRELRNGAASGIAAFDRYGCGAFAISIVIMGGLQLVAAPSQPLDQPLESGVVAEEPITPVPEPPPIDPRKVKPGERLFGDPRLSHDNSRSCSSCHDISSNGASTKQQDIGLDGSSLPLNTLTVFNATLNFRLGWEGKLRTPRHRIFMTAALKPLTTLFGKWASHN